MTGKDEKYLSGTQSLSIEIFAPASAGKHPAILILHGTFGLLPEYRADIVSFAEALVDKGIAGIIPHYLESTKTDPGIGVLQLIPGSLPIWKKACADALAFIAGDARFDPSHLGALGFSLGGHLALSLGMAPPPATPLRCIADFFGPTRNPPLESNWSNLPPVLILHGTSDPLVPLAESQYLVTKLDEAGKKKDRDYFFHMYEGEGHGFKVDALTKSRVETVEFFGRIL